MVLKNKKILYLTLKKPQYEVTSSGEKNIEFRKNGKWILSRLVNKNYEYVKFTNGYGLKMPYFICEFKGWNFVKKNTFRYSNGLEVNVCDNDVAIKLGEIVERKLKT